MMYIMLEDIVPPVAKAIEVQHTRLHCKTRQNFPIRDPEMGKSIRKSIRAHPGFFLGELDYSGIEVRIAECLVGSTLIETLEGMKPLKEICALVAKGEDVHVFAYNAEKGRTCLSTVTEGGLTGKHREVWKVTLDNGKSVVGTPDHKFMMRDGTYKELRELRPDDSLMPLCVKKHKETYNHKVVSVEFFGYDDVYNITVDRVHNYAVGAGVIVKNCYHHDPTMIKYLCDKTTDMHRDMAMECYLLTEDEVYKPLRQAAKTYFVFAQFYGDWYKQCAERLWHEIDKQNLKTKQGVPLKIHLRKHGIRDLDDFIEHIREVEDRFWNDRFPVFNEWRKDHFERYLKRGWFRMHTGFVCSGIMSRNDAINYGTQGVASHCLLWSFTRLTEELEARNMRSFLVGQIHDSILPNIHPDELNQFMALAQDIMCRRLTANFDFINIPIEIEADIVPLNGTWYDKRAIEPHVCACGTEWGWKKETDDYITWECPVCERRVTEDKR